MYLCITVNIHLTWGKRCWGNFRRSKDGLFICLLKRHIACWRQSHSMWLPVSFWSEQRQQTKGLFVCLRIYIMNILNIFWEFAQNLKKLIISCLSVVAVELCCSFRRFLRCFFRKLLDDHAFSCQLSTPWKHFSCINFWQRQEVGRLYLFLCFMSVLGKLQDWIQAIKRHMISV